MNNCFDLKRYWTAYQLTCLASLFSNAHASKYAAVARKKHLFAGRSQYSQCGAVLKAESTTACTDNNGTLSYCGMFVDVINRLGGRQWRLLIENVRYSLESG